MNHLTHRYWNRQLTRTNNSVVQILETNIIHITPLLLLHLLNRLNVCQTLYYKKPILTVLYTAFYINKVQYNFIKKKTRKRSDRKQKKIAHQKGMHPCIDNQLLDTTPDPHSSQNFHQVRPTVTVQCDDNKSTAACQCLHRYQTTNKVQNFMIINTQINAQVTH